MTAAKDKFQTHMAEAHICLNNFDEVGNDFALRHVWIVCVSAFDLYMTELVSEAGLRWIDRTPPILTANLRQVQIPLANILNMHEMPPAEKLLFYRDRVYAAVQFISFYRPEKVSEALSYVWTCPSKEKWARITNRMKETGRYQDKTERDLRAELSLIGDRRDLIAHSVDTPPGAGGQSPVDRADAAQVIDFVNDLALAIDAETEAQLTAAVA
ncbi:hypothetical protein [Paracoccus pantotrophus]|uniref:hypothetical protein n=1 Tax=Paracoccus pantotrophus TaxID=82367 RepID=UPI0012DCF69F|nr:hypothetical protein [Paracoccus pantotrophus]